MTRDRAGDVEAALGRRRAAGRAAGASVEHEDGDPDRQVDEEDPVPVERVGEHAAEQDADAAAAGIDEAEDAHRLRALGAAR